MNTAAFQKGLDKLAQPVLPLIRLVQILFLTGPFDSVKDVLAELTEPIETNSCTYANPPEILAPYLDIMTEFQRLKETQPASYRIVDETFTEFEAFEAIELWVAHAAMAQELEAINSLLCGPCGCDLCCVGPSRTHAQQFFEIPLHKNEVDLFSIPHIDTEKSRQQSPYGDPPLMVGNDAFYKTGQAVYLWQNGWSMVLPRNTSCPHLTEEKTCSVYPVRPDVCRRPQIFSYVLERLPNHDQERNGTVVPAYQAQRKVLAVWDCPYVKNFQQQIGAYIEMCEMEPIFKENKA